MVTIKNNCEAVFEYWQLESAILWFDQLSNINRKSVFMYGRYPAVSFYGGKIHIHRLIYAWHSKRILDRTEYVHHKDGNRLNARLSNLEIIQASKHQSHHNKGRKQSLAHIQKRINATSMTRYGHIVYESPELTNEKTN